MTIDNIANGETGVIVRTKLNLAIDKSNGIEPGATVNATDAALRDRATHTGTQAIGTVTDLQTALDGKQPAGSYATAAQGTLADTATQPGDDAATLGSGDAIDGYVLSADGAGGVAWEEASGGGGGSTDYVRTRDGTIQDIFDLADTWNDASVTFTSIKLNVTDAASAAASNLLNLQVGGVTAFGVRKGGDVDFNTATTGTTIFRIGSGGNRALSISGNLIAIGGITVQNSGGYKWIAGEEILREAPDTIAQKRTTNAQTFNIYNTFTNTTNYERARMGWAGNVFEIKPQAEGTGTVRTIHISGLPTNNPGPGILWNDAGTPAIGT